jgi:hypothetical protein
MPVPNWRFGATAAARTDLKRIENFSSTKGASISFFIIFAPGNILNIMVYVAINEKNER